MFERFLKAFELSSEFDDSTQPPLAAEQKQKLATERYQIFKLLLVSYTKEGIDSNLYEDSLRCIFGKDAGIFFSTDKILLNILKSLPQQDFSKYCLEKNKNLFDSNQQELKGDLEDVNFARALQKKM